MDQRVLLINAHEGPEPEFADALENIVVQLGPEYRRVQVAKAQEAIETFDPTHILISGGGSARVVDYSLTDPVFREKMIRDYSWLREINVPVLGVCLGHQIIAAVFGGDIKSFDQKRSDQEAKLKIQRPLGMFRRLDSLMLRFSHRDFVTVPEGFVSLSESEGAPYIIADFSRDIYGTQAHAEFSDAIGQLVYGRFLALDPNIKKDLRNLYTAIEKNHPFSSMAECAGCNHSCEAPQWMSWALPAEIDLLEAYGLEVKNQSGASFFKDGACSALDLEEGCTFHEYRPLECRLSPLLVVEVEGDLYWALDAKCPAIIANPDGLRSELIDPIRRIEAYVTPTIESNLRDIGRAVNTFADLKEGKDYVLVTRFGK